MAYTRQLVYETMRTIDSSTFTGSYQALGAVLAHPACIVRLINDSTADVIISTDSSEADGQDYAAANSFFLYDVTANSRHEDDSIFIPAGTQYYVKGSAGTGSVYLIVQYIKQV